MSKILIISANSFSKNTNNGKTMEAIFSNFKKDQLMQLFFSMNESPDYSFCENYYKYTDVDLVKSIFHVTKKTEEKINNSKEKLHTKGGRTFGVLKRLFSNCSVLRELLWIKAYKNKEICDWIRINKPKAIFLYAGNLTYVYDFAMYYSDLFKIPLFPFFSDDYAYFPSSVNPMTSIQRKWIKQKYNAVISKSKICFGIGDTMCNFYSDIYNKEFLPIMNSVIIPKTFSPSSNLKKNVLQFTFLGGLTIGRDKSLLELISLIKQVNSDVQINFNVYTPTKLSRKSYRKFKEYGVEVNLPVYGENLKKVREGADILIHVESTQKRHYSLAQLSVSTKIPEYLVSGKLILAYGPSNLASFKLLKDNDLGCVISSDEVCEKKLEEIKNFLNSIGDRNNQVQRAFSYAKENFDKIKNSERFFRLLNKNIN